MQSKSKIKKIIKYKFVYSCIKHFYFLNSLYIVNMAIKGIFHLF